MVRSLFVYDGQAILFHFTLILLKLDHALINADLLNQNPTKKVMLLYTCLSILLATSNYRAPCTCGPSTFNYSSNGAANA